MSVEVWTWTIVILSFALYLGIGYWARVRETAGFYVAGRGVPPVANGAATAADWMSGASYISMAGLISFLGFDGAVYLMGWTGGYVLLALLLAPYLRKFGRYTVPEFVGDRYYSNLARVVAVIAAIFVSFVYAVPQLRGVGIVLSRYLGVDVATGVWAAVLVTAFIAVLGGMKGITWTQVAQYVVLITAYLIMGIALANLLTGNPIPQLAFTFSDFAVRLSELQVELGFKEYVAPFQNLSALNVFLITLTLMVGTAGLPHVIIRFYTVPKASDARWSAGWALIFIGLLYTTAPAIAVFSKYNLLNTLANKPLEEVRQIDWVQKWEKTGLLKLEDKNGDGILQMSGDPQVNEVTIDRDIIVLSTPEVAKLAPFIVGLVAAGGLAAALSTAAGLLIVIASAISHDLYTRLINPGASEATKLLIARVVIFLVVVLAAPFGINPPAFIAQLVAFAFGLAASTFFPAILLGIFDRRMNMQGAVAGMIVGLVFTASYIIGTKYLGWPNFVFGITAEGIGSIGMLLNFVVAYLVSRATPPPPQEIQRLVDEIRIPKGSAGSALEH
ncbi:SSS sodium solute transporter superfamily protein [Thermus thermophilus]|uniref:sodium:solute symporter family protein n=1 Tax=Thermus thermophilus TaxID=274 RepID=UPI00090B88B6|nr:sodium:solute symporter family protein [Thermus thermophilus]BAW00943.1 SSS sodium solute transporter superfamily protein [Thermus thermophilus]BDB11633.1 cation acetate symporter [Thermus thermophilus]